MSASTSYGHPREAMCEKANSGLRAASPASHPAARTAFFHQRGQRGFGLDVLIEIRRLKPSFHDLAYLWPFVVKDRVPSRIPISALEDHVVVENSLEAEPKPTRCCT